MKIDYELLIQNAMRHALHDLMKDVAKNGLPGKHHFYIDFLTTYPGVILSDKLREAYPQDMLISIEDDYENLEVSQNAFSVTLTFDDDDENITVPFASIIRFTDPFVEFGIEFSPNDTAIESLLEELEASEILPSVAADEEAPSNIISFDRFRKDHDLK